MAEMTLLLRQESGYLHAELVGPFSLGEGERTFLALLTAAAECRAERVLLDARGVAGVPSTHERFQYGQMLAGKMLAFHREGRLSMLSIAYLMQPPLLDQSRFGETVAANRGASVKAFDRLEDALGWLGL